MKTEHVLKPINGMTYQRMQHGAQILPCDGSLILQVVQLILQFNGTVCKMQAQELYTANNNLVTV